MLGELRFHRLLNNGLGQPARESNALTIDISACFLPKSEHLFIAAKLYANLFENLIGMLLDFDQGFFIEDVKVWNLARYICWQIAG